MSVTLGAWLKAHEERSGPVASVDGAAVGTPASDDSPTPVVSPIPLSIVQIAQGADRTAPGPYLLDLRTGKRTLLPERISGGAEYAASPGGTKLAYVGTGSDGTPQIFTAGIEGTGIDQVTHDPTGAAFPAWSPDSTMIAYWGHEHYLVVLDLATGESTGIARAPFPSGFQFSPDGSSLIFTGGSLSRPVLRIVSVSGGKSTLLIGLDEGLNDSGNGSLSPDGSLVTFLGGGTFESGHCGPCRFVANADGTEKRVIPVCYGSNPAGTWSPDGSWIVCSKGNGIIVVHIATGNAARVAEGGRGVWLNRHTVLVEVGRASP